MIGFLNFNHDGMLGGAECQRGPAVRGEHVDAAALIDPIRVWVPPGSLRDIHHARQDAPGQAGMDDQLAAIIPDTYQVAIPDTPGGCIQGVDEDALGESLLQPVIIGMRGMHPGQAVMPDGLQRIFLSPLLLE